MYRTLNLLQIGSTFNPMVVEGGIKEDQRPIVSRPEPKNKLTIEERKEIINIQKKRGNR